MFDRIDKKLNPRILLDVLTDERDDRHPICLEPEDCGFRVEHFSGFKKLASELEQVDREGRMFHTHPMPKKIIIDEKPLNHSWKGLKRFLSGKTIMIRMNIL
ncbi:hypothetical protein SNE26_07950 [Mucilaginibacter sp. cycad4]|nr:hypothetical protein [Mucilaginibacter gossypii]WPV01702.1 hypothetical protein SNE26_07950 [Mucilaginibacter gossypii]